MAIPKISRMFIAVLGVVSSSAYAGSLGGVTVGQPLSEAQRILAAQGPVRQLSAQVLSAGDYIVIGCAGRVWGITRALDPSFRTFTTEVAQTNLELSRQASAKALNDNGTKKTHGIMLEWLLPDGTTRSLSYAEVGSSISVSQGLNRTKFCGSGTTGSGIIPH